MNLKKAHDILRVKEVRAPNIETACVQLTAANKRDFLKIADDLYVKSTDLSSLWRMEYMEGVPYIISVDSGVVFRRDYDVDVMPTGDIGVYSGDRPLTVLSINKYADAEKVALELRKHAASYTHLPEQLFISALKKLVSNIEKKHIVASRLLQAAEEKQGTNAVQEVLTEVIPKYVKQVMGNLTKTKDTLTKLYEDMLAKSTIEENTQRVQGKYAKMQKEYTTAIDLVKDMEARVLKAAGDVHAHTGSQHAQLVDILKIVSTEFEVESLALDHFKDLSGVVSSVKLAALSAIKEKIYAQAGTEGVPTVVQPSKKSPSSKDDPLKEAEDAVITYFRGPRKAMLSLLIGAPTVVAPIITDHFERIMSALKSVAGTQNMPPEVSAVLNGFLHSPLSYTIDRSIAVKFADVGISAKELVLFLEGAFNSARGELFSNMVVDMSLQNPISTLKEAYATIINKVPSIIKKVPPPAEVPGNIYELLLDKLSDTNVLFSGRVDILVASLFTPQVVAANIKSTDDVYNLSTYVSKTLSSLYIALREYKGAAPATVDTVSTEDAALVDTLSAGFVKKFGLKNAAAAQPYKELISMLVGGVGDISSSVALIEGAHAQNVKTRAELAALRGLGSPDTWSDDPKIKPLQERLIQDAFITSALYSKLVGTLGLSFTANVGGEGVAGQASFKEILMQRIVPKTIQYTAETEVAPDKGKGYLNKLNMDIEAYMPHTSADRDLYLLAILYNSNDLKTFFKMLETAQTDPEFMYEGKGGKFIKAQSDRVFKKVFTTMVGSRADEFQEKMEKVMAAKTNVQKKVNAFIDKTAFVFADGTTEGAKRVAAVDLRGKAYDIFMKFMAQNSVSQNTKTGAWVVQVPDKARNTTVEVDLETYQDKYMDPKDSKALGVRLSTLINTAYAPMVTAARQYNNPAILHKTMETLENNFPDIKRYANMASLFGYKSLSNKIPFEMQTIGGSYTTDADLGISSMELTAVPMRGMSGKTAPVSDPSRTNAVEIFVSKLLYNIESYDDVLELMQEKGAKEPRYGASVDMFNTLRDGIKTIFSSVGSGQDDFLKKFFIQISHMRETFNKVFDAQMAMDIVNKKYSRIQASVAQIDERIGALEKMGEESFGDRRSEIDRLKEYKVQLGTVVQRLEQVKSGATQSDVQELKSLRDYIFSVIIDDVSCSGRLSTLQKQYSGGFQKPKFRTPPKTSSGLGRLLYRVAEDLAAGSDAGLTDDYLSHLSAMDSMLSLLPENNVKFSADQSLLKTAEARPETQALINKVTKNMGGLPTIIELAVKTQEVKVDTLRKSMSSLSTKMRQHISLAATQQSPDVGAVPSQYFKAIIDFAAGTNISDAPFLKNFGTKQREQLSTITNLLSTAMPGIVKMVGITGPSGIASGEWLIQRYAPIVAQHEEELASGKGDPAAVAGMKSKLEATQEILRDLQSNNALVATKHPRYNESLYPEHFAGASLPTNITGDKMPMVYKELDVLDRSYDSLKMYMEDILRIDSERVERVLAYYNTVEQLVLKYYSNTTKLLKSEKIMQVNEVEKSILLQRLKTTYKASYTRATRMAALPAISPEFLSAVFRGMKEMNYFGKSKEFYTQALMTRKVDDNTAVEILAGLYYTLTIHQNKLLKLRRKNLYLTTTDKTLFSNPQIISMLANELGISPQQVVHPATMAKIREKVDVYLMKEEGRTDKHAVESSLVNVSPIDFATFYRQFMSASLGDPEQDAASLDSLMPLVRDKVVKALKETKPGDANFFSRPVEYVENYMRDGVNCPDTFELVATLLRSLTGEEGLAAQKSKDGLDMVGLDIKEKEMVGAAHAVMFNHLDVLLQSPERLSLQLENLPWKADISFLDYKAGVKLEFRDPATNEILKLKYPIEESVENVELDIIANILNSEAGAHGSAVRTAIPSTLNLADLNLQSGNYALTEDILASRVSATVAPYLVSITASDLESVTNPFKIATDAEERTFPITGVILSLLRFLPYLAKENASQDKYAVAATLSRYLVTTYANTDPRKDTYEKIIKDLLILAYAAYINISNTPSFSGMASVFFGEGTKGKTAQNNGNMRSSSAMLPYKMAEEGEQLVKQGIAFALQADNVFDGIGEGAAMIISEALTKIKEPVAAEITEYIKESLKPEESIKILNGIIAALERINSLVGGTQ